MGRLKHNAAHQYAAGLNNLSGVAIPDVPFPTPGMQGWKWIYEGFQTGHQYATDGTPWEFTAETSGTTTVGVNGALITTNGSDNSSALTQWFTPTLLMGANSKKFYLETSVNLTAASMADNEWFVGFTSLEQGTSFVGATGVAWAFADGFGFGKLDTDTFVSFVSRQSSAEQEIDIGSTLVTATQTTLGCYYDGTNYNLYINGALQVSSTRSVYNDDAVMGLSVYCKAGNSAAHLFLIHYVSLGTEL